jgi:predicted GNAT family acetyltransferase
MTLHTLSVDKIDVRKKYRFLKVAYDPSEYLYDVFPKEDFLSSLGKKNVDLFTFIERSWCYSIYDCPYKSWVKDNVALLTFDSYKDWIKKVTKITPNNPANRALKRGVILKISEPNERLARGIAHIYNETPIRQGRRYPFYGMSYEDVHKSFKLDSNTLYITANLGEEIIGFLRLQLGDNLAMIDQGLSMEAHMDKGVTRALMAKAVEISADNNQSFLMYGRIGNHPSLDRFKRLNGFEKCEIRRFFIPLSAKGKIAIKLGLHRELKDVTPNFLKKPWYPVYNFASRIKLALSNLKRKTG